MQRLLFFLSVGFFCVLSPILVQAQQIDWLETVIVEQFRGEAILIQELDSLGPRCVRGRDAAYCSNSERLFDSRLNELRKQQRELIQKFDLGIKIVSKDDYKNHHPKARYLIDYDFDLMHFTKERSTVHFLKFDFIIIDLETNQIVARSRADDLKSPFEGLELVLENIQEFQNEGQQGFN